MRKILKAGCCLILLLSSNSLALSEQAAQQLLDRAGSLGNAHPIRYLEALQPHADAELPAPYRARFLSHLAYALVLNDQFTRALELADRGLQQVESIRDADAGVRLWETKVTAEIELALKSEAVHSNEKMLAYSQRNAHHIGEAKALVFRMYFHLQQNQWPEALQSIQRAYTSAYHDNAHSADLEVRAVVNHEMGRIYERFDPERSAAHYRESIRLSQHKRLYRDMMITTHRLILLLLETGDLATAGQLIDRQQKNAEKFSALSPLFSAHIGRSRLALLRDNADGASYAFSKATALLPDIQSKELLRHYFLQQARLLRHNGEHAGLVALLKRYAQLFPESLRDASSLAYLTLMAESHADLGEAEEAYRLEQARLSLYRKMKDDARQIQQEEMRINLQQEQDAWMRRLQARDEMNAPDINADYRWRTLLAATVLIVLLLFVITYTYLRPQQLRRKASEAFDLKLFQREVSRRLGRKSQADVRLRLFYVRVKRQPGMTTRCEDRVSQMLEDLECDLTDARRENDVCYRLGVDELVLLKDRSSDKDLQSYCGLLSSRLADRFRKFDCCHELYFSSMYVTVESPEMRAAKLHRRVDREFKLHVTMTDMISVAL
jgi:hypothetical protein